MDVPKVCVCRGVSYVLTKEFYLFIFFALKTEKNKLAISDWF